MVLLALSLAAAPARAEAPGGADPAWVAGFEEGRTLDDPGGKVLAGTTGYCSGCVMGLGGACVTWPIARATGLSLEDALVMGSVQLTNTLLPLPAPYADDAYAEGYQRGASLAATAQREHAAERGVRMGYATAGVGATVFLIATLAL